MFTNKLKWKWLVPLLLFSAIVTASQQLTVEKLDGSEQKFALSLIGKITFNNGVMYLYDHNNVLLGNSNVSQIGRIVINQNDETAIDAVGSGIRVFADPAQQQIVVLGLPENQMLRIFDMNGRVIRTVQSQSAQTLIDVSGLTNGTYLLQMGAQIVKFVKQ